MPTTNSAAPFPPVDYAGWKAGVEAELGPGAVTRRLRATTEDGIGIEPLYAPGAPGDAHAKDPAGMVAGLLGEGAAGWKIRQRFAAGSARTAVDAALAGGVQSIEFTWDGVEELQAILAVMPELGRAGIETSFEGNFARSLMGTGVHLGNFGAISFGLDPIHSFLRGESLTGELAHDVGMVGLNTQWSRPGDMLLRASGDLFFNAGATTGMTLGFAMAAALAYLRAAEATAEATEVSLERASAVLEVRLPCGPRFFESAAMLRAARLVWARILEVSGIAPTPLRLVAISGRRTLTRHDPWNNALRNTAVAFAAAVGGADVLQLLPHDARTAAPGAAALRLARTTGLILQEEAYLGKVMDPAGGSWFLESLTADLAGKAWEELRWIDAAGGIVTAIESGELNRRIAEAATARHERVMDGRHPILGVSEHPIEGEHAPRSPQEIVDEAAGPLLPLRPDALPFEVLRDGEAAR